MRKSRKDYPAKKNKTAIYIMVIFITIIMLTIGYSAFSAEFKIANIVAKVRAHKLVRINGVTSGSGYVSDLDYATTSIINNITLPAGGSITYSVTVTNLGNVPVAVAGAKFTNGNNQEVNNLEASITERNYIKICENDNCNGSENGPINKTFEITITNNSSETINSRLDTFLTFKEVYTITYEGNEIGEALAGTTYEKIFTDNPPKNIAITSGTYSTYAYTDNTLTINDVESNIELLNAYTINYNGNVLGYKAHGETFTHEFKTEYPADITVDSGTYDNETYNNHILTITNVSSDISLTGIIGRVAITDIKFVSSKNVKKHSNPTFEGMNASFSVVFGREEGSTEEDFEIIYEVTLSNTHYNDYIFRGFDFNPQITASAESDTATLDLIPIGIENGDVIKSETSKTFNVKLVLETNNPDGNYTTETTTDVDTTADTDKETGEITATITPNTGSLRSPNTLAEFTVTVTSTYTSNREFKLLSSNSNLEVVSSTGAALNNFTIAGGSTEEYIIAVKSVAGATYVNDTTTMTMYLSTEGVPNISVGNLTLNVDKHNVPDTTPITVGNAQLDYYYDTTNKKPTIKATWDRIDAGGSAVSKYVATLYKTDGTVEDTCEAPATPRSCLFSTVSENIDYYVIVYGIDEGPNSGASYVSSATTANGYATKSSNQSFKWTYSVSTSGLRNFSSLTAPSGSSTSNAIKGSTYTLYLRTSGSVWSTTGQVPDDVTVSMVGTSNLSNGKGYDYTKSSDSQATLNVYNVTGDITISGSAVCLVEGTKILLANGEYKNIENIDYDDLLMVHNYETGELTYEYPIWIEKTKKAISYQENTFSDGTILKTIGWHGVFETELNRFVSVDNPEEFHIGSKIAKLNNAKNGYDTITVTNIEQKSKVVNYYHVVSTRYYNIIANDIITTDGTTILSNLYGFNENITWPKEIRDYAMQDVYSYDELSDAIPYYMFKGLRAEEGKVLSNYGLDLNTFKGYLLKNQNNPNMLKTPIQELGRNMWMVTTSLDNVNELNKRNYLRYEGSTYTLPKVNDKKFKYWLNTADNQIYHQSDKIIVYHGMHFEAIYK